MHWCLFHVHGWAPCCSACATSQSSGRQLTQRHCTALTGHVDGSQVCFMACTVQLCWLHIQCGVAPLCGWPITGLCSMALATTRRSVVLLLRAHWRTLLCRRPYLTRCAMNHEGSLQACPAIAGAVPRVFAWVCTMQRGTTISYCGCPPLAAAATVQLQQHLRGSQQQAGTRVCRACPGMESPSTSAEWPRAKLKIE